MAVDLHIAFHNLKPSDAVESHVREKVAWLETFHHRIQRCRVTLEVPHRHHRQGNVFAVKIDLKVPGNEIVVNRQPAMGGAHEDIYVALRDAFDAARRRLKDYDRCRRGAVKLHQETPRGRVTVLHSDEDYGVLEAEDGHEVYFHKHSVHGTTFESLEPGMDVIFEEEPGAKGPQAVAVRLLGHERVG